MTGGSKCKAHSCFMIGVCLPLRIAVFLLYVSLCSCVCVMFVGSSFQLAYSCILFMYVIFIDVFNLFSCVCVSLFRYPCNSLVYMLFSAFGGLYTGHALCTCRLQCARHSQTGSMLTTWQGAVGPVDSLARIHLCTSPTASSRSTLWSYC